MPTQPKTPQGRSKPVSAEEMEYRRKQSQRLAARKKRKNRQFITVAVCLFAIIIVIVILATVLEGVFKKPKKAQSSSFQASSQTVASGGLSWPTAADKNVWNLKLVNTQVLLGEEYAFEEAQIAQGAIAYFFDARIIDSLSKMIADCNAVEGNSLAIISGRCGPTTQNNKHNYWVDVFKAEGFDAALAEEMASEIEPPAGQSEHQIGLAVDFITGTVQDSSKEFANTPEYQWLMEHCTEYGFILRYPQNKEGITGILFQPYHFRYVGVEDAQIITSAGICLEEYLADVSGVKESVPSSSSQSV